MWTIFTPKIARYKLFVIKKHLLVEILNLGLLAHCGVGGEAKNAEPMRNLTLQGSPVHCYQFLKRPYSFEKDTQKRPIFFLKRDLKETFFFC